MTPLRLRFVDNAYKHGVTEDEAWEVFLNRELPCLIVRYKTSEDEKIYNAFGVTETGRYLTVGFVKETAYPYRVIHAMDMKASERRRLNKLRKRR